MLCTICQIIHFKTLGECDIIQQEPHRLVSNNIDESLDVYYFHQRSWMALEESMKLGCHFCAMLWDGLFRSRKNILPGSVNPYTFAQGEVILKRQTVFGNKYSMKQWNTGDWIYIRCGSLRATTSSQHITSEHITQMLRALTMAPNMISTDHPHSHQPLDTNIGHDQDSMSKTTLPLAPQIFSSHLDTSTTSLANIALASFWLQYCSSNHQPCKTAERDSVLPSRVIDVSREQQPRLVEGMHRKESYVTLSYKWGQSAKYYTLANNLQEHEDVGFPLGLLPRTFQDAISVTRSLGFRWLWIDALCIVQDKQDEMQREMSVMDQIFASSTVTLFAAVGAHADSGLSFPRDARMIKPCALNLKTTIGDRTVEGSTHITVNPDLGPSGPLYSRGWVLQEEVLSTRGIYFEHRQIRWRCLCGSSSDTHPSGSCESPITTIQELGYPDWEPGKIQYACKGSDGFNYLRMWIRELDPFPNHRSARHDTWFRDNHFDHWYSMVEEFGRRALTYESDALPALAGIATAMAKTHGCTYLAGLWHEDLQTGLCWYVKNSRDLYQTRLSVSKMEASMSTWTWIFRDILLPWFRFSSQPKNVEKSTPSWSWVSQRLEGVVFRGWENQGDTSGEHENSPLITVTPPQQQSAVSPYLAISQKTLTITGLLKTATVKRLYPGLGVGEVDKYFPEGRDGQWESYVTDPTTGIQLGRIMFDSIEQWAHIRSVFCLLCAAGVKSSIRKLTCLALIPVNEATHEFIRVGLVVLDIPEWFGICRIYREGDGLFEVMDDKLLQTVHLS